MADDAPIKDSDDDDLLPIAEASKATGHSVEAIDGFLANGRVHGEERNGGQHVSGKDVWAIKPDE